MYIPKANLTTDQDEIVAFMKEYSFATLITTRDSIPVASHLPFTISRRDSQLILSSHFAKANNQWQDIENHKILVVFSEPHAYISTKNYERVLNVPTWNYITIHAYGDGKIIHDRENTFALLENMMENYEPAFRTDWNSFPDEYKSNMAAGIVAFEIVVTDLQGKMKLSQNRSEVEQQHIISTLSESSHSNEKTIAEYMIKNLEKSQGK
jgi:transcriptional regulator